MLFRNHNHVFPEGEQMSSSTHHELLTVEEVAALLRVPVRTLHQWRYLDRGPRAAKVGRRLLYRRTDIDTWLDSRSSTPAA